MLWSNAIQIDPNPNTRTRNDFRICVVVVPMFYVITREFLQIIANTMPH